MAEVVLKDIVKIYPYVEKKPKKKLFSRKVIQPVRRGMNLQITEKGVVAVQNFNLKIKDGEFIVLVGPSGCGKSTTLRMVAGLEEITEGELYIDGKIVNSIEPKDRDIAMVFQNYALYPHMTVYQNMAYSLKIKHIPSAEIDRKVREAAAILNITDYLERKPKNLSGGQRQRVAIGRAIVRNPKLLLMDEPLSNLDAKLRNQMRAEIIKLRKRINTTFIYVTHDQVEAMTLGDRIVVMKDGFVQQIGTPQEVFDHPRNLFVSGFIGTPQMNYFDAKLDIEKNKYVVKVGEYKVVLSDDKQERLKANNTFPQEVTLGVRPDHMIVGQEGIDALVEVSELMGPAAHLHLNVSGKDVIVIIPTLGGYVDYVGQNIKLGFPGNLVHVFSKKNERNLEYNLEDNYVANADAISQLRKEAQEEKDSESLEI
jgi:multiple sugar transport system ATP-binding protein